MASSLEVTDNASAAIATAPRVSLTSMEAKIAYKYEFTANKVVDENEPCAPSLDILSLCILVMENGFVVVGKAAPASSANFNRELGKQFAYEDAIRQLWPLEGYALRERLNGE